MIKMLKGAALALVCALVATAAIASTPTTNYSWLKPTVGADANAWGTDLNSDLDGIDSIVFGIQGTANAACPKAGCTLTGALVGTTASFSSTLGVTGAATLSSTLGVTGNTTVGGTLGVTGISSLGGGASIAGGMTVTGQTVLPATNTVVGGAGGNRAILFSTGTSSSSVIRWLLAGADASAETGSNAGSNFGVARYSDSGILIDTPLNISRSSGLVTLSDGLTVAGTVSLPSGSVASAALANTAVTASTYGSSTQIPVITVNAKGQLTGVTTAAPAAQDTCVNTASAAYCENAEGYFHEWGVSGSAGPNGGTVNVTLPLACVNTTPIVQATATIGGTNGVGSAGQTLTTITLRNNMGTAQSINWAADCN